MSTADHIITSSHHHIISRNGVLNVDKPAGPTSHDVVARVRRLAGTRRVGHAGTLDPAATGVLVVLLGVATRLAEYLTELPKRYEAMIRFGLRTDTQDTTGTVLTESDASALTAAAVEAALARFRGEILQTPPMVSAVKVEGKRLYELARRGETVERAARPVTIHELSLTEFHPGPAAWGRLVVGCSSGTYVRTLCADLGEALGVGAAMGALRRTRIGPFRVEEAVSLEALSRAVDEGRLGEVMLPPGAAVAHLPAVTVGEPERERLLHGMAVEAGAPVSDHAGDSGTPPGPECLPECGLQSAAPGSAASGLKSALRRIREVGTGSDLADALPKQGAPVRVLDEAGALIAIGRWEGGMIAPVKVLAGADATH
jgi:tRNA pseudouridine55 synthase